jgi:hypothetical protein
VVQRICQQAQNKPFALSHCWKLLEHSEKSKLTNREAAPARNGAPITLYDDDSDDAPRKGRSKWRMDRKRQVNLVVRRNIKTRKIDYEDCRDDEGQAKKNDARAIEIYKGDG